MAKIRRSPLKTSLAMALGLGLLGSMPLAVADGGQVENGPRQLAQTPLQLEQILQLPNLQASGDMVLPENALGSRSVRHGQWQYQVTRQKKASGWAFVGYKITRAPSESLTGTDASAATRTDMPVSNLIGGASGVGHGPLPPGPGHFEPNNPPETPDDPIHHGTKACPFGGTSYDMSVDYKWVPAHFDDETGEWVSAHWELEFYDVQLSASAGGPGGDFCP